MKRSLYIVIFFLQVNFSFAQPFGGNNAIWHYNFCSWLPPLYCSPVIITSSAPIISGGVAYYALSINDSLAVNCSTISSPDTVYESNDSVYYYLTASNRYAMLYNWNALPGDTQIIYMNTPFGTEDSIIQRIDSTGIININGFNKKIFYTSDITPFPQYDFGHLIIEDIGSTSFLFPQYGFCDPLTGGLRCYEDTIIGLYQPWMPGSACDSVIYLGENELENKEVISIYPNPAKDDILIVFPFQKTITVKIYSVYGRHRYSESLRFGISQQATKLSLKNFPPGIYFLKINSENNEVIRRIVKM